MTHTHAKRAGVVPRPSEAHLRMLARMVKRAEVAAKAPEDSKKALALTLEAEKVSRKAILPVGHQNDAASPVVRLIRAGMEWHRLPDRAAKAQSLADLALWTREVLDACLLDLDRTRGAALGAAQ